MTTSPETNYPDYHIRLTDQDNNSLGLLLCNGNGQLDGRRMGDSIFPRMALQTRQGSSGYEGQELPFVTLDQKNWSGGIGNKNFADDPTRYTWGQGVDTSRGPIVKGPAVNSSRDTNYDEDYDVDDVLDYTHLITTREPIYAKFTPTRELSEINIGFASNPLQRDGITVSIIEDDNGTPSGNVVATCDLGIAGFFVDGVYDGTHYTGIDGTTPISYIPSPYEALMQFHSVFLSDGGEPVSLSANTTYWLALKSKTVGSWRSYGIIKDEQNPNLRYKEAFSHAFYNVNSIDYRLPFVIFEETGTYRTKFFEYKNGLYKVVMKTESGAPQLYRNGYRGLAEDNDGELNCLKSGIDFSYGEVIGATVMITWCNKGILERDPYRKVIDMQESVDDSGNYDVLIVDHPWTVRHNHDEEFVILGTNYWAEMIGHGLTEPVRDVLVINDIIYFTQGDITPIQRMREYANNGVWTTQFDNDGSNAYDYLEAVWDPKGKAYIYAGDRDNCLVKKSEVKNWGTNLSFNSEIKCGYGVMENMVAYGSPRRPYIFKRDEIGYVSNDIYQALPLAEIDQMKNPENGKAVTIGDVYLYFTLGGGYVERYYDGRLEDIGPDRDEGIIRTRKGEVQALLSYPGRIFAAVDGGPFGQSSILVFNGIGWHCLCSNNFLGGRISDLFIQTIPGEINRLWFNDGPYSAWIPISWNPKQEAVNYTYADQGMIITSWIEGDFADIEKYWHSCKLFGEGFGADNAVKVYYQTENDSENFWHYANIVEENGIEVFFTEDSSLSGKRLRLKLIFDASDTTAHAQIDTVLIYCVERVSTKRQHQIYFLVDPDAVDLNGQPTSMDEEAIIDQLRTWQDGDKSPLPLTLNSAFEAYDNVKVFLDSLTITRLESEIEPERKNSYLCSATLLRV